MRRIIEKFNHIEEDSLMRRGIMFINVVKYCASVCLVERSSIVITLYKQLFIFAPYDGILYLPRSETFISVNHSWVKFWVGNFLET